VFYPLTRQGPQSKWSVREHRFQCVRVLKGLILAAVYAKYRSAGRTTARGLILGGLAPKIKPIYQFYIEYYEYYQP